MRKNLKENKIIINKNNNNKILYLFKYICLIKYFYSFDNKDEGINLLE